MSLRSGSPMQRLSISLLLALAAAGCKRTEPTPPPAPPPAALAQAPAAPAPAPTPEPAAPPAPIPARLGWTSVSLQDTLPICVFSNFGERENAPPFPKAKKQKLEANAPVVFGVYPPWCLNPACDERNMLQCWTEREGTTLIVHTRYASDRKNGATCAEDCVDVDAACETPPLEPGAYTVRHGDKTYELRIPSVVRAPCFGGK